MKILRNISYCLLLTFIVFGTTLAQEMKAEAAQLYNDGNKLMDEGNFSGAVDNYNKALAIEKDYRTYYQKGIALKKSGNHSEAIESFEACIKMKGDFEAAYNALGGVYFAMGNYQSAVTNFEKVLSITSNNNVKAAAKKNLSLAYAKLGKDSQANGNAEKAIEYYTKSAQNNNYDAAYLSLAELYNQLGQYDKAIGAAENALKYRASVGKGGPYYYMGIAYKGKGDVTKAKEMFNQAKADATYKKTAEYELSLIQ